MKSLFILISTLSLSLISSNVMANKTASGSQIHMASAKLKACISALPADYKESVRLAFKQTNPNKKMPRFMRIKLKKGDKATSKRPKNINKKKRNKKRVKGHKRSPEKIIKRMNMLTKACETKTLHKLKFKKRHKK